MTRAGAPGFSPHSFLSLWSLLESPWLLLLWSWQPAVLASYSVLTKEKRVTSPPVKTLGDLSDPVGSWSQPLTGHSSERDGVLPLAQPGPVSTFVFGEGGQRCE